MVVRSIDPARQQMGDLQARHQRSLERQRMRLQEKLVYFVCCCLGVGLAVTLTIFLLQGFGARVGFRLDAASMRWIGTATVGCVSTLSVLVYKCFFPANTVKKRLGGTRARSG